MNSDTEVPLPKFDSSIRISISRQVGTRKAGSREDNKMFADPGCDLSGRPTSREPVADMLLTGLVPI